MSEEIQKQLLRMGWLLVAAIFVPVLFVDALLTLIQGVNDL